MKSFIVSLGFFSFFIIMIWINCIKVESILDNIMRSLDELPSSTDTHIPAHAKDSAEALCKYWSDNRIFLSLTINNAELRDIETALGDLAGYSDSDTGADYDTALTRSKIRIRDLAERERISLSNIF